jgi:hypothetical protein
VTSIENETFRGDSVRLDGKKFLCCAFENCVLYYGGERCEWENSRFLNCRIVIDGKARNTMQLLVGLGFQVVEPDSNGPKLQLDSNDPKLQNRLIQ